MSTYISDILSLVFGNIAIIINVAISLPQLISIAKTKNTSGTSLSTYILFAINGYAGLIGAIISYVANISYIDNNPEAGSFIELHVCALTPMILSNLVNAIFSSFILGYKISYLHKANKLNLTEIEYSQLIFDQHKKDSGIKRYRPIFFIVGGLILLSVAIVLLLYFLKLPEQITATEFEKLTIVVFVMNTVAAVFNESISGPQFIKCMKTKDTSGISLGWSISLPLSCAVCVGYDICIAKSVGIGNVLAALIFNGVIINVLVLILKLRNHFVAKKLGISEGKYTKKYIATQSKKK